MASVSNFINRYRPNIFKVTEVGIGGFTLFARIRDNLTLAAESPATPVEDGSFVNDHVILKPLTISIEGDVSEIHLKPSPIIREFQRAQAEIGNLTGQFAPSRTQAQLNKVGVLANSVADAIRRVDAAIDAGQQAIDYLGNRDTETKKIQEQFLDAMEALHFSQQLITIDMPFRQYENMVITNFTASTDNAADSTSFTIDAQQLRFADLQFVEVTQSADGTGGQLESLVDKGTQAGDKVSESLATQLKNALFGD